MTRQLVNSRGASYAWSWWSVGWLVQLRHNAWGGQAGSFCRGREERTIWKSTREKFKSILINQVTDSEEDHTQKQLSTGCGVSFFFF